MIRIILFVVVSIVILQLMLVASSLPQSNKDEKCDIWAQEGECVYNPNFMWSTCHSSCMSFARDDDERCNQWAVEGECTNNPGYIQVHCPVSCSRQIGWNYWIRHELNMQNDLPFHEGLAAEMKAKKPSNLLAIVKIMYQRLEVFMSGGHLIVQGLATTAPTPFLGIAGLGEAFIYTLRLIEVIVASYDSLYDISTTKDEHMIWKEHLLSVKGRVESFIVDIDHNLSQNEHDGLGRYMPTWVEYLNEIITELEEGISVATEKKINIDDTAKVSNILDVHNLLIGPYKDKDKLGEMKTQITLSNGVSMPILGLGTWQIEGEACSTAVKTAVSKYNYRFIDTAEAYHNEKEIGDAITDLIKEKVVDRKDLFVATKLSDAESGGGYTKTKALIEKQLKLLQLDYIDLYMLHSPFKDFNMQVNSWKAIEDLYTAGQLKSIGVSNFNSDELVKMIAKAKIKPMVLQNKADVYHVGKQTDLLGDNIIDIAKQNNISIIAYSPLSAYPFVMQPLFDPLLQHIADTKLVLPTASEMKVDSTPEKININGTEIETVTYPANPPKPAAAVVAAAKRITASQVALRWLIQHDIAVIPRSVSDDHLKENMDVVLVKEIALSKEEMAIIDSIQYLVESQISVAVPIDHL